jgi:metallopeptidase family M12-like protein/VCBS repeat protein
VLSSCRLVAQCALVAVTAAVVPFAVQTAAAQNSTTAAPPLESGLLVRENLAPERALGIRGPRAQAIVVRVERSALARFRRAGAGRLTLPIEDGRELTLNLSRLELLSPNAAVTTSDASGSRPLPIDITLFKGVVEGDPTSSAVLSMTPDGVLGSVETAGERYVISRARTSVADERLLVVAPDRLLELPPQEFRCGAEASQGAPGQRRDRSTRESRSESEPLVARPSDLRLRCQVAIDCDYEFFADRFHSDSIAAAHYMLTVLATISAIYERDLNVTFQVSYFNIWTTADDPYTKNGLCDYNDPEYDQLREFRYWWLNYRTEVHRDVAHLVTGRFSGGCAYIGGTLCNTFSEHTSYGMTAVQGGFEFPNNWATWDVFAMAHEIGHNFGSPHTHSCFWQGVNPPYLPTGALIDTCYTPEGFCYSGPTHILPPDKGTIMSYCHIGGGVPDRIRLAFHPICVSLMRQTIDRSPCLDTAAVQPPTGLAASQSPTGVTLTWMPSITLGVTAYDVYRSNYMLDPNPVRIGSTPGLSFSDLNVGPFQAYYKVRALKMGKASYFSGEVEAAVCGSGRGFAGSARYHPISGCRQPWDVLVGDFNEDGISDLASANSDCGDGGDVAVLLGGGTGGVWNGSFAPPAQYGIVVSPLAIASADFSVDGIADLATASFTSAKVSVLLGQGSGGVGTGAFALTEQLVTPPEPRDLLAGDLIEDGIPDLAVACRGQVAVFQALGSSVPGSTFCPQPVVTALGGALGGLVEGDFNEDGILDLAVTVRDSAQVAVLLGQGAGGQGNGTFAAPVRYATGSYPSGIVAGDFNEDGITDLAVANTGGSVSVLIGRGAPGVGDGSFAAAVSYTLGSAPYALTVADFSRDGIADLAVADAGRSVVEVLLGNGAAHHGDGTFLRPKGSYAVPREAVAVASRDFNGDGAPDLVVASSAETAVSLLMGSCTPSPVTVSSPNGEEIWIIGDFEPVSWTKRPGVGSVNVDLSRDGGSNWEPIAVQRDGPDFKWLVTGPPTEQALVRVYDPSSSESGDVSDGVFQISLPVSIRQPLLRIAAIPGQAGRPAVELSIPGSEPARLDLWDIAGRKVESMDLSTLRPGTHTVVLGHRGPLMAGLYFARLTQAGQSVTGKVVVID